MPLTSSVPRWTELTERPAWTSQSTVSTDLTFHQLAPYIGRMKTSMARFLIQRYTRPGDLVADPFCGSGVVALEAAAGNRRVCAGDWNSYAVLLTRAKLHAPVTAADAEGQLRVTWEDSRKRLKYQDLRRVPAWIRRFFHKETLRSALAFRDECVEKGEVFLLACLLGILHHQRPGFLSFPSSHLVPYLRNRRFPRDSFPEMYEERDVLVRLQAKIRRTFKRPPQFLLTRSVAQTDARLFSATDRIQAVVTSPPYMNELDYVRDNRLRLWFIERKLPNRKEPVGRCREEAFRRLLGDVCMRLAPKVVLGGRIILVVGDVSRGRRQPSCTATLTDAVFSKERALGAFKLDRVYCDTIPDIRRSRRECRGTKTETVLVYEKRGS